MAETSDLVKRLLALGMAVNEERLYDSETYALLLRLASEVETAQNRIIELNAVIERLQGRIAKLLAALREAGLSETTPLRFRGAEEAADKG